MMNRGRNYMDRLLGRNEGSESLPKSDSERDYNTRFSSRPESDRSNSSYPPRGGFFGKGPKGYQRSDEKIKEEVCEALYRDNHVDASDIEVDVKEGIVTLAGTVDSRQTKRAAEQCVENLTGVIDVHNRVRIAEKGIISSLRKGNDSGEKSALS